MPYKDPEKRKEKAKEYQKKHYEQNKEYYKNKTKEYKEDIKDYLIEIKSILKCSKCNEDHPACLDFHHLDSKEKEFNIAEAVFRCYSKEKIQKEIEKCIVLCANCHRKLHYQKRLN